MVCCANVLSLSAARAVFLLQEHLLVESPNWCVTACYNHNYDDSCLFPLSALALKGIEYEYRAVHLLKDGGEQVYTVE